MANFNLTKMAVNMYCPGNVVQMDDAGLPSILVYIPAFKNSDVLNGGDDSTHPAFIVNGKEIPGFYYSKYQNVVHNGKAYSLPAEDPQANVNFDTAREYCEAKGYGWHLSTAAEWAAIALWCKKNGFLPYGNNNYGKDYREVNYKAAPTHYNANDTTGRVATGTGPLAWSHDKTTSGIWDMNGNILEWQGGIRIVWGELQVLANNDAADTDKPQNNTSTCWKAINAANGSLVEPESKVADTGVKTSGNTVKLDCINNVWKYSTNITTALASDVACQFNQVTCDNTISDVAKLLLRALALLPDSNSSEDDYGRAFLNCRNGAGERLVLRGGCWDHGVNAGIFSVYATDYRSSKFQSFGFRSAYIPNI